MEEHVFSINEFNQPKVLEDLDAIYVLIIRLLLMNKGTNKSHPDMGVGLIKRYRYSDASEIDNLRTDIYNQISEYIPILTVTEVTVSYSEANNNLTISVTTDKDVYYVFTADFEKETITLESILNS